MTGKNKLKITAVMTAFFIFIAGYASAQVKFGPRTEHLLKMFESGAFHLKATMTGGGQKTEIETFTKSGMSAVIMSSGGQTTRIIARDNNIYMIDEVKKMQYFIDGNKIARSRTITPYGNIDTVISVLDQNVPVNAFNIPATGYQIQDMSKVY